MKNIIFTDRSWRLGCHMEKLPTLYKTIDNICSAQNWYLSSAQIYISNSRSKKTINVDYDDLKLARDRLVNHKEIYFVIHGCLLYNLAGCVNGENDNKFQWGLTSSIEGLTSELDIAVGLGKPSNIGVGVVVHPGSSKDRKRGHELVSNSLVKILVFENSQTKEIANSLNISVKEVKKSRKIILENSAGEGTKLCTTLEEIGSVIKNTPIEYRSQIKVCIDTAHSFGSGIYDWGIKSEIDRFYKDFDEIIGISHLEVLHLNDSYRYDQNLPDFANQKGKDAPFGSKKDRHQMLGLGYIFGSPDRLESLAYFVNQAKKFKIPIVCETQSFLHDFNIIYECMKDNNSPLMIK